MLTHFLNDPTGLECWKCDQTFSWQKCIKILELNFWKDFNEKYLNFGAKYRLNIHELDFGIIRFKYGLSFGKEKNIEIFVVFV
jgi:hypothetical protein